MQRILVTGSRGFVGSRILASLERTGQRPIAFAGDVREPDDFARQLGQRTEEIDVVIHAAALVTHRGEPDSGYWSVNVDGTRNLLSVYDRQKFVFVSTTDVLRANLSAYAESKAAAEALVRQRDDHCIVRLVSVFGPGQRQRSKLIPRLLCHHVLGGPVVELSEDVRPYCYVDDAAACIIDAVHRTGTLTCPSLPIENAELAALVGAVAAGAPIEDVPPAHQALFQQLRVCAEALRRDAASRGLP